MKHLLTLLFLLAPILGASGQDPIKKPTLKKAQTEVKKSNGAKDGSHYKGHAYVDLGLSVKWATCNIGANKPEEYGDYFAWRETQTKSSYTPETSKTFGVMGSTAEGPYSSYDAAQAKWGGSWRLPLEKEQQELIDNCTWTWTIRGGHNGYKVTSKKNGNSIFLPAAGGKSETTTLGEGSQGFYWNITFSNSTFDGSGLEFEQDTIHVSYTRRFYGLTIRPVTD